MEKKLVLPGDHLSSAEEAEPGENTYTEKDEVYSAAAGENLSEPGKAAVRTKGRFLEQPAVGMAVFCLITKAGMNKAIAGCIPAREAEGGQRGVEIEAVLPVTAIRNSYVREVRDEVRVGDIIKARILTIDKTGFEISMKHPECGVLVSFCPRCRMRMELRERIFTCPSCSWKDRKKLPLAEGEAPPPEEMGERRGRPPFRERGGFRREGGRGGERRGRPFGRRPGPGGRPGSY
ncbi:MAG: exosome complex RNA-binding protein Csl4 [Candidatus Micrarchaeota archaeon]